MQIAQEEVVEWTRRALPEAIELLYVPHSVLIISARIYIQPVAFRRRRVCVKAALQKPAVQVSL